MTIAERPVSHIRSALILACSLLTVLAACTTGGAPPRPTTAPTTTTVTPRPTVAPPVTRTLDLAAVWDQPCAPVGDDFLARLGLAGRGEVSLGRELQVCVWQKNPPHGTRLAIGLHREDDVLGRAYKDSNGPNGAYFQPTVVAGQPAVVRSVNPEARKFCDVVVGTGPAEGFSVVASHSSAPGEDCTTALAMAEEVVRYLGG